MMENKEQKVAVWCDFNEGMNVAILHAVPIAITLRKELCLFHLMDQQRHERVDVVEARLRGVMNKIAPVVANLTIRFLVLQKEADQCLVDLSEQYECLLLVAHKNNVNKLLPLLKHAAFPFLFVSAKDQFEQVYKRIVVPVGYLKKSKDLALWASYLGRNNNATIDVFLANEKDQADHKTVMSNLLSVSRLYEKFQFPFQVVESHCPTWKLQRAALNHTLGLKSGMLLIAVSFNPTLIDSILGLTEKKVLEKSDNLSVLCVNSRRDFYTFCG